MKILIHPYSRPTLNGEINAKNYAYWPELLDLLAWDGHWLTQIGKDGEEQLVTEFLKDLPFNELEKIVNICDFFISVDSFFPHFVYGKGLNKPGVVLWTVTDPEIYGYPQNLNLLQSKNNLRQNQFDWIEHASFNPKHSVGPRTVKYFIDTLVIPKLKKTA